MIYFIVLFSILYIRWYDNKEAFLRSIFAIDILIEDNYNAHHYNKSTLFHGHPSKIKAKLDNDDMFLFFRENIKLSIYFEVTLIKIQIKSLLFGIVPFHLLLYLCTTK